MTYVPLQEGQSVIAAVMIATGVAMVLLVGAVQHYARIDFLSTTQSRLSFYFMCFCLLYLLVMAPYLAEGGVPDSVLPHVLGIGFCGCGCSFAYAEFARNKGRGYISAALGVALLCGFASFLVGIRYLPGLSIFSDRYHSLLNVLAGFLLVLALRDGKGSTSKADTSDLGGDS